MSKQLYFVALVMAVGFLFARSLQAQDQPDQSVKPSSSSEGTLAKISKDTLVSHGFSFDDQSRPMCKINGSEGQCRVEAFVFGETTGDEARFSCAKLDRATYIGHCLSGKLDGLSLVTADGKKKVGKEAYISYFSEGRIAYPALTSYFAGDRNFGVREKLTSYGCVYFGKWDKSNERCAFFIRIYSKDLFTESNAEKLRDGTFDLDSYRSKFLESLQR